MGDETRNSLDGQAETAVQARDIGVLHVHASGTAQSPPVPHQLPARTGYFEDRREELARILAAVEAHTDGGSYGSTTGSGGDGAGGSGGGGAGRSSGDGEGGSGGDGADGPGAGSGGGADRGPLVLVLTGMGGIGKTALAQHAARLLAAAARFPDGILSVDLDDGRRHGVASTSDAVDQFLAGLHVDPKWWAKGFAGRIQQYWSRTQGKRLLVLIDNARYEGEATPLLPASPASVALVLAPTVPADLEGENVVEIPVPPLPAPDSVRLLGRYVGEAHRTAAPDALATLARGCEGLPAALTVAGRWARDRSRRRALATVVTELTGELREKGIPMVEAVWNAGYESLSPEAALLYRLLPQLPSPVVRVAPAAALAGTGGNEAGAALDELEGAGLLLPAENGTLRMHTLLRGHATRVARAADPEGTEAARARARVLSWYRRQAARADLTAAGARLTFARTPPSLADDVEFPNAPAAYAWLRAERHALYGAVTLAFETGRDEDAWALCEPLWTHFMADRNHAETTEAFRTGLAAADRSEHLPAMIRMRAQLAYALWEQGDYATAGDLLAQARGLVDGLGEAARDLALRASVIEFGALLLRAQGDYEAAAREFRATRTAQARAANPYGELLATYQLARTLLEGNRPAEALPLLRQAHAEARAAGRSRLTARTAQALARALRLTGALDEAAPLLASALANARARSATKEEAETLTELAHLAAAQGDPETAARHHTEAHRLTHREGGQESP
jgi:tetratricopeptide (TPR) repeat protein